MSAGTLLALAERCEREDGGFHLDKAILLALGYSWRGMGYWYKDDSHSWNKPSHFTTSLDSAVTLVPAGAWRETNGPRRYLNIPSPVPNYWHTSVTVWEPKTREAHGWAATEAMSICAAALRARAAMVQP